MLMGNPLAYKLAIDLVKLVVRYHNNVEKGMRFGEWQTLEHYCFCIVDAIAEDNMAESKLLLHRVKMRLQILAELEYIAINHATLMVETVEKIGEQLQSHGNADPNDANHNNKGPAL